MEKITAIYVEPAKAPKVIEIENDLKAYQEAVGGLIDVMYNPKDDNAVFIVNDEFLVNGSWPNRYFNDGSQHILIRGSFLVVGDKDGKMGREFTSLTPEQVDRYMGMFGGIPIWTRI